MKDKTGVTQKASANDGRYSSLDGIRSLAAVGIVLMHVKTNSSYQIGGVVFNNIIPLFTNLIYLFMIISGFSMCCGYYDKIQNNKISINSFYSKRYMKIWPYFAVLVLLDLIMSPSASSLIEAFADMTLCFGLLPNANISVIGVGWTLGVIFVFYMLFPFFCFLLKNKVRAWFVLAAAVIYNIACTEYFFDSSRVTESFSARTSFIFCAMFFIAGGLIYLYRDLITGINPKIRIFVLVICFGVSAAYFGWPGLHKNENLSVLWVLVMFSLWMICAIGSRNIILNNKFMKFLSGISMEIYLSHMIIFRIIEKTGLSYLFGAGLISYLLTVILTLAGAIVFSLAVKKLLAAAAEQFSRVKNKLG